MFRLGKEETEFEALQMGRRAHVAACWSEKVRAKIDHCLEWRINLVVCHLWWRVTFWGDVTPWLGVPSQESLTHLRAGFDRDGVRTCLKSRCCFEKPERKVGGCKVLFVIGREQMRFLGLPRSDS